MFYLLSRFVSTTAGSVYPCYASYKAIKANDAQALETWLMYWVVMGTVMAAEGTVEWVFAWFPFYYEVKTLVILWLVLPQIQGSTYIYLAHVHPFLSSHEQEIDAAVANAKSHAKEAGLGWLNRLVHQLREIVVGTLAPGSEQGTPQGNAAGAPPAAVEPPPSHQHDAAPASGLASLAGNYLRTYGPAAVAAGTAFLHPMKGRQPTVQPRAASGAVNGSTRATRVEQMRSLGVGSDLPSAGSSTATAARGDARQRRRAELEAELAGLDSSSPSPSSASPTSSTFSSSSSPANAPPQRIYHPRSASAGVARLASETGRDARSIASSFEEIRKDELGDYPPPMPPSTSKTGQRSTSTGVAGGWWKWGSNQPASSDNESSDSKDKDA